MKTKSCTYYVIFALVLTGMVLLVPRQTSADHGQLTGDDIKKVFSDVVVQGSTSRGKMFEQRLGGDGSLKVDVLASGYSDTGKWTIEGNAYCSQWDKLRYGKKSCYNIRHLNGDKYLFKGLNGAQTNSLKIIR